MGFGLLLQLDSRPARVAPGRDPRARRRAHERAVPVARAQGGALRRVHRVTVGMTVAVITEVRSCNACRPTTVAATGRAAGAEQSGLNAAYVAQLFADYLDAPASVPDEWRRIFEGTAGVRRDGARAGRLPPWPRRPRSPAEPARAAETAAAPRRPPVDDELLGGSPPRWRSSRRTACTATSRRASTRSARSRWATPRSTRRACTPLTPELQARIPAKLRLGPGETLLERCPPARGLHRVDRYEIEHISTTRRLAPKAIGRFRQTLEPETRIALLRRLSQVEGFEQYLRRSFLGQKQFSLEGLDTLVPMLDETIAPPPRGAPTRWWSAWRTAAG